MITKQRPPLIYTIERSGTNFICHCFNYIFLNPVSTHDKNKKFTFGEDIDYKKYRVFSTIREPKELLLSEIYSLYEQLPDFSLTESELIYKAKQILTKQTEYLKDLINHEDFYIMPFEYFTKDTYSFFIRLAEENSFSNIQKQKIDYYDFFKNPLADISESSTANKIRYPREYKKEIREYIEKCLKLQELSESIGQVKDLYNILIKRYDDGQYRTT